MAVRPRIFLAGLFHETNTFTGSETPLAAFEIRRDNELLADQDDGSPRDGFLSAAASYGWNVVPGVDYRSQPSGMVSRGVFDRYWDELAPRLDAALEQGLDAIFLILHGAMAAEGIPDVEGELLERLRLRPGVAHLPIFAVLDLHANVSERMARHASALIPYRENPHSDARDTAMRAAHLLRRALVSRKTPRTHLLPARVLLSPPQTGTASSPMRDLEAAARALERSAGHWEVGIAAGFAHADTPDTGLSFWVVSSQPEISCHKSLETLYCLARRAARDLRSSEWPLPAALDRIAEEKQFPALLVEPADNIGGGAPGNATFLLQALLERPFRSCGIIINDPAAVSALANTLPGGKARISLGAENPLFDSTPIELEVTLQRHTNGIFQLEDRQSHLASMAGCRIEMGPCAVVVSGHVTILLTSRATPPFDLGQWRSQGIEPADFEVIGVKAAVGHKRAYDPIAKSSYTVATPGPCASDLSLLPYRLIRRPIFPLDDC